ncbi:MAG TPA: cell division ATP-binding protein FtsE [Candidatus Paceibacterota bacterium]
MIYFDRVTKIYEDDTAALRSVTFRVAPHELVALVGRSGAGKTSLLKMLLGEEKPTSGSVYFESADVQTMSRRELAELRRRVGTVFQDFRLLPNKNVFENVAFAMEVAGRSDEEIHADVPHVLELVGLSAKAWNFPAELSGGERQRVGIARALVNQPDVLVADEPTGNLDPENAYDIVQIFKRVNDLGTTVILTTHNPGVVDALRSRVITIDDGQLVRDEAGAR